MRIKLAAAAVFAALSLYSASGFARPNADAELSARNQTTKSEVVVFEIGGCGHCTAFRDNLGARYLASTTNAAAPLRYVDVGKIDPDTFHLRGEITTVPTIVLLQDGREVDRVEGYPVSQALFGMVKSRVGAGAD